MELTMINSFGFCELNENEMMMVDGGGEIANGIIFWGCTIAAGFVGTAIGAAVGGPVGAYVGAKLGATAGVVATTIVTTGCGIVAGYFGSKIGDAIIAA